MNAQKYFYAMHEAFEVLTENVSLGRDATEFIVDLKRFLYQTQAIFYRQTTTHFLFV